MDVFKGLEVLKEKRESSYLTAYLSCWPYVFTLSETGDRIVGPETLETTNLMASSYTFSLVVPILASLYHGLNGITHAVKPFHS